MGKKNRTYKSAKRNRELVRQKKQEKKRLSRLVKDKISPEGGGSAPVEDQENPQNPEPQ